MAVAFVADAARSMKRFYKAASVAEAEGGHQILLDGRPVRTPARSALIVPSARLADAIAAEWNAQGEEIAPASMPFTGLANAAIDRVATDTESFARSLALFGESDLLCYRAEGPESLVERQSALWDPLLAWARQRFDIEFEIVSGIVHRAQPARTVAQLAQAVAARTPFELAGLAPLVTISGSLIIGLAVFEQAVDLDTGWKAAILDEDWQAARWGEDADARAVLDARQREVAAAERFVRLL